MCKPRHIMPWIALPNQVEIPALVFWIPLQPIHQENIIIYGSCIVSTFIVIGGGVWIRESNSSRWFQEEHICNLRNKTRKWSFNISSRKQWKRRKIEGSYNTFVPCKYVFIECFAITVYSKWFQLSKCSNSKRRPPRPCEEDHHNYHPIRVVRSVTSKWLLGDRTLDTSPLPAHYVRI